MKFLYFKRHTCSRIAFTRLLICLYSSWFESLWFLLEKKSWHLTKESACFTLKELHLFGSRIDERILLVLKKTTFDSKFQYVVLISETWQRSCCFGNNGIYACCDHCFLYLKTIYSCYLFNTHVYVLSFGQTS